MGRNGNGNAARRPVSPGVQEALLRMQRGVQRRLQAELRATVGDNPPALERYYRDYLRDLRGGHRASSFGELHEALLDADLVLVGDYHTLRQSQEIARRLLERAALDARPVTLGLEMVLEEHQPQLDAYVRGDLDDDAFLAAIRYRRNWDFRWRNYRPLLETARRHGIRVLAVNAAGGGIRERDARIARRIATSMWRDPEARHLVLIGDLHLATNHLPAELDRAAAAVGLAAHRRVVVYQNSDDLYWDLAARGADGETQVVRLGADRFCVQEVPPWVKLQSYLGWEKEREALDEPLAGPEPTSAAVVEHLADQLAAFFDLGAVDGGCDAYTNLDEGFFEAITDANLDEERQREIHLHAFTNRSCFVPELDVVYLPYLSVHHAAEEAMHLLLWRAYGFDPTARGGIDGFYARVLWNALGFTASKIVNPRRRAADEAEVRAFLREASRALREPDLAFRKLVARFVVQHFDHEQARRSGRRGQLKQIYEQEPEVTLEIVHALGSRLGDRLAYALRTSSLGRGAAGDLVRRIATGDPQTTYFDLVDWLARSGA